MTIINCNEHDDLQDRLTVLLSSKNAPILTNKDINMLNEAEIIIINVENDIILHANIMKQMKNLKLIQLVGCGNYKVDSIENICYLRN